MEENTKSDEGVTDIMMHISSSSGAEKHVRLVFDDHLGIIFPVSL